MYIFFGPNIPVDRGFDMLSAAGFGAVSLWWGDEFDYGLPTSKQPDAARRAGLDIDYIHIPYTNCNDLWLDCLDGDDSLAMHLRCIDECGRHGIGRAVMHLTAGDNPPPVSEIGINRLRLIVSRAHAGNVTIAFENLNYTEYLDAAFRAPDMESAAFCYDSGHENAYTKNIGALIKTFAPRLQVLHLHDNDGTDDQHLLPGLGNIDFGIVSQRLAEARYEGRIMLECFVREPMPMDEYLGRARIFCERMWDEIRGGSRAIDDSQIFRTALSRP